MRVSGTIGYPVAFAVSLAVGSFAWWLIDLRPRSKRDRAARLREVSQRVAGGTAPFILMILTFAFLPAFLLSRSADQPLSFWLVAVPLPFVIFSITAFPTIWLIDRWKQRSGQTTVRALLLESTAPLRVRTLIVMLWAAATIGPIVAAAIVIPKMFEMR